jgi:hypothetical protein
MPTIRLGPLGTFRFTRTRQDPGYSSESTTRNDTSELKAKTCDPPPPYSECVSLTTPAVNEKAIEQEDRSLHTPIAQNSPDTRPVSPKTEQRPVSPKAEQRPVFLKAEQLRRFILEILAIMVDANFDLLNDALCNIPSPTHNATSSLPSIEEHTKLFRLSVLASVQFVDEFGARRGLYSINDEFVFEQVEKPAQELLSSFTAANLVPDLIGWYINDSSWPGPLRARARARLSTPWVEEDSGYRLASGRRLCDPLRTLKEMVFELTEDNYRVREILDTKLEDWRIRQGLPPLDGSPDIERGWYEKGLKIWWGCWHAVW